jgi:predicted PurR-regulated permease PerM
MKIEIDKKLLKYSIYIAITTVIIYVAFLILNNISLLLKDAFDIFDNIITLIKPLLIGIVIAYLLYPVTKALENFLKDNKIYKLQNASARRIIAIVFSYFLIIGIFLGLLLGVYFMIGGQISKNTTIANITQSISIYINNASFSTESIKKTLDNLDSSIVDTIKPYIISGIVSLQSYIENNLGNMTSYVMSIGSSIATFFIALVISIYLLKDSEYFLGLCTKLYYLIFRKSKTGTKFTYVFGIIHEVFAKYLRGQLLEAFFVGVLSAIALAIVGIDYAFVIGIIAGISNMIPYVGPVVGTILAGIMGLLSGNPIKVLYAVISMLVVQQIDNNLLAPKIVGESVGLHAVFTMMAIIIGGSVGGLLGMLLAVPVAAACKVLFSNWYDNYMKDQEKAE